MAAPETYISLFCTVILGYIAISIECITMKRKTANYTLINLQLANLHKYCLSTVS